MNPDKLARWITLNVFSGVDYWVFRDECPNQYATWTGRKIRCWCRIKHKACRVNQLACPMRVYLVNRWTKAQHNKTIGTAGKYSVIVQGVGTVARGSRTYGDLYSSVFHRLSELGFGIERNAAVGLYRNNTLFIGRGYR